MVARWFVSEGAEERQRREGLSGCWIGRQKKRFLWIQKCTSIQAGCVVVGVGGEKCS